MNSITSLSYFLVLGALVVLCAQLVSAHEEHLEVANHQVTLKDICANRQVPIVSVPEARRLIRELYSEPELCQEKYRQAFYELETVLSIDSSTPLCSEREFDKIKEYHFRYINPLVETYKFGDDLNKLGKKIVARPLHEGKFDYTVQLDDFKQEILIPISLSQFFKAWALQVSGMCKRTLVDNIDKAMQLMSDMDYELLENGALETGHGSLKGLAGKMAGDVAENGSQVTAAGGQAKSSKSEKHAGFQYGLTFNKLVYLPELEGELEEGDQRRLDEVKVLDLRTMPALNKFMHACERRFKPVYAQLIMPIVRLSKLGYEYVGPEVDDIRPRLYDDALLSRWMLVTMICESQGRIELVQSDGEEQMQALEFSPIYNYKIEGNLWIKGAEALRKELDRISGEQATGFKKFLYHAGIAGRRAVAFLDPHQSAWYRRNQNTLSSTLNTMSILSNLASIFITVTG